MIAAWLAQLLDAEAACKLAVYLHGMAGDLAEADEGEVSMTAGDLVGHLGDAIMRTDRAPQGRRPPRLTALRSDGGWTLHESTVRAISA